MLCMVEKDQRHPRFELAMNIVKQFPLSDPQRELIVWYLTRKHTLLEKIKHDYPNTFEDLRTAWFGKDTNSPGDDD